jgi:hypothetical protein
MAQVNPLHPVQNQLDEIREQIHEIRNFLGPMDIKLDNLDHQITKSRLIFESRASAVESLIAEQSLKIADHSTEIGRHSERLRRIEMFLKMPLELENPAPGPVHQDKPASAAPPSQNPPA